MTNANIITRPISPNFKIIERPVSPNFYNQNSSKRIITSMYQAENKIYQKPEPCILQAPSTIYYKRTDIHSPHNRGIALNRSISSDHSLSSDKKITQIVRNNILAKPVVHIRYSSP